MRQVLAWLLTCAICLSLCSCGREEKTENVPPEIYISETAPTALPPVETPVSAEVLAKQTYSELNKAYDALHIFSEDLYKAWEISIFNEKEIRKEGFAYFASRLTAGEEDILQGIARTVAASKQEDWDTLSPENRNHYLSNPNDYLTKVNHLISFCVYAVGCTYTANETVATIRSSLDCAKSQLKELDSGTAYYPILKDYYMALSSHLDFCLKPDGTYEMLQRTSSTFETNIRNYRNELDFLLEN